MDGRLLVRMYNVALGDCIYLRVPDQNRDVHILIDCGNKFAELELLGEHIAELKKELPDGDAGKKRLDLLVVSHPHEDHHKGFEEAFFGDIQVERIWLSPAFDRQNPKAEGFFSLQDAARRALLSLSGVALGGFKDEVDGLLSLSKDEAIDMLCNVLPQANGIEPLYVTADTPLEQLQIFEDPAINLKVLGPMGDIDAYYLGGEGLPSTVVEPTSQGLAEGYAAYLQAPEAVAITPPENVSSQDFGLLRSRVPVNALAIAELAGHAVNNLSVVLLLEWRGRRLLFPGDAEWRGAYKTKVKKGRSNGSWNVMWQERRTDLSSPLDFLKLGHHGSKNATPWAPPDPETGQAHPISVILDSLLPSPEEGVQPSAQAIASTERTSRWPSIPDPALMAEIGQRVANKRTTYKESREPKYQVDTPEQPQRTDLEMQVTDTPEQPVPFIEISFSSL